MLQTRSISPCPVDPLQFSSAGEYLHSILAYKQSKNSRYSFRSFARHLTLPASTTNSIINRKRRISHPQAELIAHKLGMTGLHQTYFYLLVDHEAALEAGHGSVAADLRVKLEETAWMIRASRREDVRVQLPFAPDWQHLVVMMWITRSGKISFQDLKKFARGLDLTDHQARETLQQLITHQLVQMDADGVLSRSEQRILLSTEEPDPSFCKVHESMAQQAIHAIREQKPDQRYSATELVRLDAAGFQKLKELSNAYLDQVQFASERGQEPKDVYCISLHAFQLTDRSPS